MIKTEKDKWLTVFEEESRHFARSLRQFEEQKWSLPFNQYAVVMSNVAFSFLITSIVEGEVGS